MNYKVNPFKPNSPINPGMFAGRLEEIQRLERHLLQTKAGYPANFLLTGERGIGKSSLLNYLKFVAQGKMPIGDEQNINFLVIDTDVDASTTQGSLVRKIELSLRRELSKTEKARSFLSVAWDFIKRVEAAGIKLNPEAAAENEELLIEEFSHSLAETVSRICDGNLTNNILDAKYDGVLLLIDEADNASKALRLGSFLKLLSERLYRRGCEHISIGLAGLPDLRNNLLESHPSSLRLFEELVLDRLTSSEINSVIDISIEKAEAVNHTKTTVTPEARQLLVYLSDGYPHFIQQFGYSAFDKDKDNSIDRDDVTDGAFETNGAIEQIGNRYYRNDYYNKIQGENYRQVLRIMADKLDGWITKQEIREKFKGTDEVLTNAIKALRDRHIIISKEGVKGVYRLQHKGFALWIKLYAISREVTQGALDIDRTTADEG